MFRQVGILFKKTKKVAYGKILYRHKNAHYFWHHQCWSVIIIIHCTVDNLRP